MVRKIFNPKLTAQYEVHKAVYNGQLHKPSQCERCGKTPKRIMAHHHKGYGEHALDVQWLCGKCHSDVHCHQASLDATTIESRRARGLKSGMKLKDTRTHEQWAEMGRKGGIKGGKAIWAGVSPEERSAILKRRQQIAQSNTTHEERSNAAKLGWLHRRQRLEQEQDQS